jgi:hypothetical protein
VTATGQPLPLFDAAAASAPPARPPLEAPPDWPRPPDPAAYHGPLGEIVHALAPETEADPVAILAQLLVAFGSAVGRGAYFQVEATRHHGNEFLLLAGDTAKARKGSSWDHVLRLIERAEPALAERIATGLASGEGLVWAVRDPAAGDPGARDPRLLVVEPEFASVLKATARELSTLSPTLRSAWDGRPLQLLTRTAPARSAAAHISVIGHITLAELRQQTRTLELANGFLNRFLILCCRRVRLLPEGGHPDPPAASALQPTLTRNLHAAQAAGRIALDPQARTLWHQAYPDLSAPRPGLAGALLARAEAHTIRLALLYALADGARAITRAHLEAALALYDYAARSAGYALESTSGNPLAEQIHTALQRSPDGLTRTQLRDLFQRNLAVAEIAQALATLAHTGRAARQRTLTGGRPAELWTATSTSA